MNNKIVDVFKRTLISFLEHKFSKNEIWQLKKGWDGKITFFLVNKYLNSNELMEIKKNTVPSVEKYSEKQIMEIVLWDIMNKKIFIGNAFSLFDKKETEDALLLILSYQNKDIVFKNLLLKNNLIKQSNVADIVWSNKSLLSKIITKSNIEINIKEIELILDNTSDKNKVEAFKKIYSLLKDNITEFSLKRFEELEDKYLSKIQKIIFNKTKPKFLIKKQNLEEIENFINQSVKDKKIIINVEVNNEMLKDLGFNELKKYIKGHGYGATITNDYARFQLGINPACIFGTIEYKLDKNKENYGEVLEIVLKKTIIKILTEIEKNIALIIDSSSISDLLKNLITPEIIDKEFANNRHKKLLDKVNLKDNNISLRKKI